MYYSRDRTERDMIFVLTLPIVGDAPTISNLASITQSHIVITHTIRTGVRIRGCQHEHTFVLTWG